MASNDDQSRADTCMGGMAHLPWWMWLALAALSYLVLHALALRPQMILVEPADVRAALAAFLVGGVEESLQYVAPALCMSALLAGVAQIPWVTTGCDHSDIFRADGDNGMTAWDFERLTAGGLRSARVRGKRFAAIP